MKPCVKCGVIKDLSEFRNRNTCKVCENKLRYQRKKNKRKIDPLYDKMIREYDVKRKRKKEKESPVHGTIQNLRSHIRKIRRGKGFTKKSNLSKVIGISWDEFKIYFESKFQDGMTWDNHGLWEYDHIIPVSSAKTIDEVEKLFHYSNLQPLWKEDNRLKSNKIL